MPITKEIKQRACEGLLHMSPKKRLARELGVSIGSIRDWSIYIKHGFFDWIDQPYVERRKELLGRAIDYWMEQYPIGYTDVAVMFGVRPATLYNAIHRKVSAIPEPLRPKRIRFWDVKPEAFPKPFKMKIEKLSDIPADRPLTQAERKALFRELQDNKARLICSEAILEVALENCKDEIKKKEIKRQLELTREALKSLTFVE